jgi:hypothetical protein
MAVSLKKFDTQSAWEFLLSKYSKWHLSRKKGVRSNKAGEYTQDWAVKSAFLSECLNDLNIVNEDNAIFILESFFDTRRFWYCKDEDYTPVVKKILGTLELNQEYIDSTFKKYALVSGATAYLDLLWDRASDEIKDEVVEKLRPYGIYSVQNEDTIVYFENKKYINFINKKYGKRNFRHFLPKMSVSTLEKIKFNISDDVIKLFADAVTHHRNYNLKYLFTLSKFREKVIDNPKWMFYSKDKYDWHKFIDYWPREYQQPYIDQLKEELRLKKLKEGPKKKEKKVVEEPFVDRTEFSREFFKSCLPELRKLKQPGFKLFEKKVSDKEIIDAFEMIFKTKSPHTGTMKYEVESEFDFEGLIKKKFADKFIKKYARMPFDLKKIRKEVTKEASELVGLKPEDNFHVPTGCYWIQDKDAKRIFGARVENKYLNVSLRIHIIYEVMKYVEKHRNITGEGVHRARNLTKDDLVGKFVVTESMVMSGFLKGCMTLKQIGFLPGEIVDQRYGERHGLDNFWDDNVPSRNYIVMKLENVTGAKELEKKHWKKQGLLYAIDITDTLLVFDTMEQAKEIAAQLNEENKNALTLNY